MKKPDSWMPFYIGDYLRDTMSLRREDHGSYLLLIMAYWTNGGPLPNDDSGLQQICRCPDAEWLRTKGNLQKYFSVENGIWRHKRIDSELAQAKAEYEAQCERTKAATAARQAKQSPTSNVTPDVTNNVTSKNNVTSDVTSDVTFTQPQPQPQPQVQSQPLPPAGCSDDFKPTMGMCEEWLMQTRRDGSDYTKQELKSAFLALSAGGWKWGTKPIADWRSAIERQIQTDRQHSYKPKSKPDVRR